MSIIIIFTVVIVVLFKTCWFKWHYSRDIPIRVIKASEL